MMSSLHKSERGVTLVEVLATLTVLSLVLGVAFMLFSSVHSLWTNSVDKYTYNSSVNLTLDTISKELAEADQIYLASATELRFKTVEGEYFSLAFDSIAETLILYESVTVVDITATFNYDTQMVTTNNVLQFSVIDLSKTAIPVGAIANNQLFYLSVTIEDARVAANNGTQIPVEILIKPFKR